MADSRVRWTWLVWGCLALVAIGCWAAQAMALQAGYERLRRDAGASWTDGGTAFVWDGTGPGLEIRAPSFILDVGGRQVSWHAADALLHAALPGRDHTATARLQRVRTAGGEVEVGGALVLTLGTKPRLQADALLLGTTLGQLQVHGLRVEQGAGSLAVTADRVWAAPLGERLAGERVMAKLGGPGAVVPLHALSMEWGGARLATSGTLGLDDAGRPMFTGVVALTGYAGALDRLVESGDLTLDAARAISAVLAIHAAARPPAPLTVMLAGGVLTVAGFPLWRAE